MGDRVVADLGRVHCGAAKQINRSEQCPRRVPPSCRFGEGRLTCGDYAPSCATSPRRREDDAEARAAAHHAIVGGVDLVEREDLVHGSDAGHRAEGHRVL